jgi:AraC-like DNA-binding protein
MIYKEIVPDTQLADLVKCFWWFDNPSDKELRYTILPDGCFDLIILFRDNCLIEISLTGLWTKQVEVPIDPNTQIFAIRFKLLAVDYIFKKHIASICDSELVLPHGFWGIRNISFADQYAAADTLNKVMVSLLHPKNAIDTRKLALFTLLTETHGQLTIEDYVAQVHWTSRQMNRYFRQRFGVSLKVYCNILKCYGSFKHLKQGKLYPEQNYFDQSHFVKALKKHTGQSPSALYKNKNDRFLQLATLKEE